MREDILKYGHNVPTNLMSGNYTEYGNINVINNNYIQGNFKPPDGIISTVKNLLKKWLITKLTIWLS